MMTDSNDFIMSYKSNIDAVKSSINKIKGIDLIKYAENTNTYRVSPLTSEILSLFIDVHSSNPNASTSEYIIDSYTEIINESKELTATERRALNASLSVASTSPKLWTEIYLNQ